MVKFVAGPCVIESAELLDQVAERLVEEYMIRVETASTFTTED